MQFAHGQTHCHNKAANLSTHRVYCTSPYQLQVLLLGPNSDSSLSSQEAHAQKGELPPRSGPWQP
jgi:hypothetical protein